MKNLLETVNQAAAAAFEACGYDAALGIVTLSDRLDLCQFQCNGSFAGAKLYRKAPLVIAGEVSAVMAADARFKSVEAVSPGFINITLTDSALLDAARDISEDEHAGVPQCPPQTVIIDYGGPNVAKPLHIGHLRSAIIGESLKRIARSSGLRVIGDVHLGDWGLQMGLVIAELECRNPEWRCFSSDFDPDRDTVPELDAGVLNEIYPFASAKSKDDDTFKAKARAVTAMLQTGHTGYTAVWREMMRVSVADMKELYGLLGVDFDLWYGESDAEKYVADLLDILNGRGLLYESDGAMVVDVSREDDKVTVPPVIVKKSDNSNMYATTDLATILQRMRDFTPDELWYVVDKRQSLHFTQVFRCAEKAGISGGAGMEHLGFGTMNGSDGKPYKTRDGGVMRLSDLLKSVIAAARDKIGGSGYARPEDLDQTAYHVAVAAIKFGDLINHRSKDYIFDIEKFLSFEGKTGTYLLYTVTRINSVLKKAGIYEQSLSVPAADGQCGQLNGIYSDAERALYLAIAMTPESLRNALRERAPNHICENAYRLASLFSTFYHDSKITSEPDAKKRESWLAMCVLTRRLLTVHLELLGIQCVEAM